jgi:hypothetical protein
MDMEGSDHGQSQDIVSVALPGLRAPLIPLKYRDPSPHFLVWSRNRSADAEGWGYPSTWEQILEG